MLSIVERAITAISSGDAERAAYLLEKAVHPDADSDSMGWPGDVITHCVTDRECVAIEQALVGFIESNARISSAVWALGKAYRRDHQALFEKLLRVHLDGDSATLFQAMIAAGWPCETARRMCHCFGVLGEAVRRGETTSLVEFARRRTMTARVFDATLLTALLPSKQWHGSKTAERELFFRGAGSCNRINRSSTLHASFTALTAVLPVG